MVGWPADEGTEVALRVVLEDRVPRSSPGARSDLWKVVGLQVRIQAKELIDVVVAKTAQRGLTGHGASLGR